MKHPKAWCWLTLIALSMAMFIAFDLAVQASPLPPDAHAQTEITEHQDTSGEEQINLVRPQAAGDTIEVFTNTWSYSTIGMVYDPSRDTVRYAHESQSSTHNPTVYDVDTPAPHSVVISFALSTLNTGWPWQLDNRTGAGYNADTDTYFLADYNGDLSNADDNIVEIDVNGTILNAWEMDDEIGSNDSADGTKIDSIIDIAVVPGSPPRYFVTAAYDDAVVYEVVLTRTGTLWTPNSWATVMTYTGAVSETFRDNLGIDYDAQNNVLYHSGWHTTTILVTDLDMNPITEFSPTFDCPGAGGYNSGVTFIEGSTPPEVWVTDFSSDQTTRCEAPGQAPIGITWNKWIDDVPWDPHITHIKETTDTLKVVDVITAAQPLQLMERWNPRHLRLLTYTTEPAVGQIVTGLNNEFLEWNLPPAPDVVTMTKTFRVLTSTWTTTLLSETLWLEDGTLEAARPVTIEKRPPELYLYSDHPPQALAGSVTTYTLTYENVGGYESDVEVRSHFPITAPFLYANPFPTHVGGGTAIWEIGDLPGDGTTGQIDVVLEISPTVKTTQTVEIPSTIHNHLNTFADDALVSYAIEETTIGAWMWEKFVTVNGEPRDPETIVTVETSNTLQVVDVVSPDESLLTEAWNPDHLHLETVEVSSGSIFTGVGFLEWTLLPGTPTPATITKTFHVSPCTWTRTEIWEEFAVSNGTFFEPVDTRPVFIEKRPSDLWITSAYDPGVDPGAPATFVLHYGNTGGFESGAWIRNTFPPEAIFMGYEADPPVMSFGADPQGRWAEWDVGPLADGDTGVITVTVEISPNLSPGDLPPIHDFIYDHADNERGWTEIVYHVRPPQWEKQIDHVQWYPGISFTMETSNTFTVVDVITGAFQTTLNEFWNPERLELLEVVPSEGEVITQDNRVTWHVPYTVPVASLSKIFRVKSGAWTESALHEELWVAGDFWQERPTLIRKEPPDLQLTSDYASKEVFPGERVTYTLAYENLGGYENGAWVTSTFPISAPIIHAVTDPPIAQQIDPQGRWAKWDIGALDKNEGGLITVSVALTETLPPYAVVHTYNYIYSQVDTLYGLMDVEHDWQPINYQVKPVEPTWEKEIWIDGEGPFAPGESPYPTHADDTVAIVDRVYITAGAPISYTLTETWGDVLSLSGWTETGGTVMTTTHALVWEGHDLAANAWHVLTKTYHIVGTEWDTETLTETLTVVWADPETDTLTLEFDRSDYYIYLPLVMRNHTQ